jgi:hypothetical protein
MYKEYEIRKTMNDNDNYWRRVNSDGTVEYFNKDFYNKDFDYQDKLLREIEEELCN